MGRGLVKRSHLHCFFNLLTVLYVIFRLLLWRWLLECQYDWWTDAIILHNARLRPLHKACLQCLINSKCKTWHDSRHNIWLCKYHFFTFLQILFVIISCNNISGHNYIFYDEEDGDFNMTDEQALLSQLMWSYDRHTRPVLNASHPVKCLLGITLNQIFDVVSGRRWSPCIPATNWLLYVYLNMSRFRFNVLIVIVRYFVFQ